jgi:TonB family protein
MEDSRSRKPTGTVPAVDNRLEPRYQVKPVEYTELGESNGGIVLNVSEHGMAVSSAQPLGGDQTLRLRFQLPGFPNTIETVGEISWIGESKRRTGIRFVDLPESAREQIRKWIILQPADLTHDLVAPETEADSDPPMATIAEQTNRPNPARNGNSFSRVAPRSSATPQEPESETDQDLSATQESQKHLSETNLGNERRSHVRKSVNASAYLRLTDGNAGLVANVSETGLSFRAAKALEGERIFVRFQLPDSDQFIESPALIVWKSASKKKVGARFVSLPYEAREQIVQWIGSRSVPKSAVDPNEQSRSVTKASEVSASPRDLAAVPQNFSPPEQSDYLGAKPEETVLPAGPRLPPFLTRPALSTPDRHLGVQVSEVAASDVASDSGLPTFYRAYPLNVAPKESSNFWKVATVMVLIGGAGFGGGIYFSRSRQISASSYENVNQGPDTLSAHQSEGSISDSGIKPSTTIQAAATDTDSDRVTGDADRQPGDKPPSQRPHSKELLDPGDSRSSKHGRSDVPVEDPGRTRSGRRAASSEPATAREKANNFAEPADTRLANRVAAARQENTASPAAIGADDKSKLESEANARLNQESKTAVVSEPSQQPHAASNAPAFDSSAATRAPYTAGSNSAAPAPVRNLVPSVSFFSRFRSIRASSNSSNLSSSGELQIGSLRSSPVPVYPAEAQQRQVQGLVELDVMVGTSGEVQSVRLVKGPAELAEAATQAVRGWQFTPTLLVGHAVETEHSVIFTFKLGN